MSQVAFVLLFILLPFSNGSFEDMVETGYVQDPDMVGKLPIEFQEELDDIELERDDLNENADEEENQFNEMRSLHDDLEMLDPEMRSEIEDYCNSDAGKTDEALCNRCTFIYECLDMCNFLVKMTIKSNTRVYC